MVNTGMALPQAVVDWLEDVVQRGKNVAAYETARTDELLRDGHTLVTWTGGGGNPDDFVNEFIDVSTRKTLLTTKDDLDDFNAAWEAHPDWVNSEVPSMEAYEKFPWPVQTFGYPWSVFISEELEPEDAAAVLEELRNQ